MYTCADPTKQIANLIVKDSGEGDARFDPNEPSRGGTGSRILRALVRQLKRELRVENDDGTCVKLQFPCGPVGWDACV
ncbi:two-component sensor histidine kinase [Croceicoccus naphthovorans]|nr:two-component sensor histidine kinase [Croceicoccus naphthovorans]